MADEPGRHDGRRGQRLCRGEAYLHVDFQLVHELDVGMLLISHDLSVLADLCDRIVVMYAGRVVEQGPAKQVFADALHPYAAALSASFPKVGDPPDPSDLPPGCSFAPRCPRAIDECTVAVPELTPFGPDRTAACIRVEDQR